MFTQHVVLLPYSFGTVERVLSDLGHPWTAGLDGTGGAELLARVGVKVAGVPVYKHVKLELAQPPLRIGSNRMLMSVSWHTSGGPPLFPVLEGHIEVEGARAEQTTLSLKANYAPPLGGLGRLVDRTLLRGLAQATVKDFVERLAEALDVQIRSSSQPAAQ
jgi:hypothetical protein